MSETLHDYYMHELRFMRELAGEFGRRFPATANRLFLEPDQSRDPHVERLIESFALLAGRVHHKIDDEFPELTDSLLGVLYPHYLAPVPSIGVVQFEPDTAQGDLLRGYALERGSKLRTQAIEYQPGKSLPVHFRTCYPVRLWPITVTSARLIPPPFPAGFRPPERTAAALRLQLECRGEQGFAALTNLSSLRFFLFGDNQLIANLYDLIFNNTLQVVFRAGERDAPQPNFVFVDPAESRKQTTFDRDGVRSVLLGGSVEECLGQVGFERDEGLLPYPNQSFLGYRLLTEFFAFPQKFLFFDLGQLAKVREARYKNKLDVILYMRRSHSSLEQGINAETFRLGCTPIVNLFETTTDGIPLTQNRYEYRVTPDVTHWRATEVYSVDQVIHVDPSTSKVKEYAPFYSFKHGDTRDSRRAFWYASRRPSLQKDEFGQEQEVDRGTEVFVNLVDLDFDPRLPGEPTLIVKSTCTNRDLTAKLQHMKDNLYFELEQAAPLSAIRCVRTPTAPLRPPLRRGAHWRLVSHLNINHLSISDPVEGKTALQEILRLYDFSDPEASSQLAAVNQNLVEGILSVRSKSTVGRLRDAAASGFARGTEVTIEFDEPKYLGVGCFLFACVLERFLALYTTINSFTQLVGTTKQGGGAFKRWPPRAGEHRLL
jgi:type VI secretion system protein ImpG